MKKPCHFKKIFSPALFGDVRVIVPIALLLLLLFIVVGMTKRCKRTKKDLSSFTDYPAMITSIQEVIRLSSSEIEQEIVVVDTIDHKVIAMVVKARSYIDFDLDKMERQIHGDTLVVTLPPEEIKHYETGLWVIDHYSTQLLKSKQISAEEENTIKKKIPQRLTESLYKNGYIAEARKRARNDLLHFLGLFQTHVEVYDPYPDGNKKANSALLILPREPIGQ